MPTGRFNRFLVWVKYFKDFYENKIQKNYDLSTVFIQKDSNADNCLKIVDISGEEIIFEFETNRETRIFHDAIVAAIKSNDLKKNLNGFANTDYIENLKDVFYLNNNKQCAECPSFGPEWGNYLIGITICSECSLSFRKMGPPFGTVKGLWMDVWQYILILNFINLFKATLD